MEVKSTHVSGRQRFLNTFDPYAYPNSRPPIWFMRQAGRYLPEYRKLKEQHGFKKMIVTPDLAAEVSLMPMRRFPIDAAIVFSDILELPGALGMNYSFRDQGGIEMDFKISDAASIRRLDPSAITEKLSYVGEAIQLLKDEVGHSKAILGFGGSPFTLASYMIDGSGANDFHLTKKFYFSHENLFYQLLEKLKSATVEYFKMQIQSGVDAIQIFDSSAFVMTGERYWDLSLRWIRDIIHELPRDFPIILFTKNMWHHFPLLAQTGAKCLSLDYTVDISAATQLVGNDFVLQGNLDPIVLTTQPAQVQKATQHILQIMDGKRHIFNLGHGITPDAKLECVEAMIETVCKSEF